MCACKLNTSPSLTPQLSPSSPSQLEDYYKLSHSTEHGESQLLSNSHSYSFSPPTDLSSLALAMDHTQQHDDAVYHEMDGKEMDNNYDMDSDLAAQLAQKDQDLVLAAELGKALLEKNEELVHQNEKMAEEFHLKIEELTQEKYALKLHLDNVESECEMAMKELQGDIKCLKRQLIDQAENSKLGGESKARVVYELTKQNERMTEELKQAAKKEESLIDRITALKDQLSLRHSVHNNEYLDKLHHQERELEMLGIRKSELEHKIADLLQERDMLTTTLDHTQERTLMLERQHRDMAEQLECHQCEVQLLKEENSDLKEKLSSLTAHLSASASTSSSVFNIPTNNTTTSGTTTTNTNASTTTARHRQSTSDSTMALLDASADSLYTELEMYRHHTTGLQENINQAMSISTDSILDAYDSDEEEGEGLGNVPDAGADAEYELRRTSLGLPQGVNFLSLHSYFMSDDIDDEDIECDDVDDTLLESAHRSSFCGGRVEEGGKDAEEGGVIKRLVYSSDEDDASHHSSSSVINSHSSPATCSQSSPTTCGHSSQPPHSPSSIAYAGQNYDEALMTAYRALRALQFSTTHTHDTDTGSRSTHNTPMHTHDDSSYTLVTHIVEMVSALAAQHNVPTCGNMQQCDNTTQLQPTQSHAIQCDTQVLKNSECQTSLESFSSSTERIDNLEQQLQKLNEELAQLKEQLKVKDCELKATSEELLKFHVQSEVLSSQCQKELIDKAAVLKRDEEMERMKKERDVAVSKRSRLEMELARSKLDMMSLDKQLMEAIQQKVQLSQQLDQWQVRMHASSSSFCGPVEHDDVNCASCMDDDDCMSPPEFSLLHDHCFATDMEELLDLQINKSIMHDKLEPSRIISSTRSTPAPTPQPSPAAPKKTSTSRNATSSSAPNEGL